MLYSVRAAALAVACFSTSGLLSYTANAQALPPLKGLPLLYDANNKLIGPYDNSVVVPIKGRYYNVPANANGFGSDISYQPLFYTKHKCAGKAFVAAQSGLIGSPPVLNNTLYLPSDGFGTQPILSSYNTGSGGTPCTDYPNPIALSVSQAQLVRTTALGFTPPFSLRAP